MSLFPTLAELAGLPPKPDNDGPSLVPLLDDPDAEWPDVSVTHLAEPGSFGLSTQRWRYIHYAGGDEELYDCVADPHEWNNLAGSEEHAATLEALRAVAPKSFAARVPAKDSSLPKLEWQATDGLAPASKPDGDSFDIVLVNQREDPVDLYWMNRQGKPRSSGSIPAGWRIHRSTRPGSVWFVTQSQGKSLGYFVVGDRSALATIPEEQ